MERTDQTTPEPTPVVDDAHATAAELQQRAAAEFAAAQTLRDRLSREDRTGGNY